MDKPVSFNYAEYERVKSELAEANEQIKWDDALVKKLRADLELTISNYEAFMCEMTGNKMSKCNYDLQTVIAVANDYQQSLCDECSIKAELATMTKQFNAAIKDLQHTCSTCKHGDKNIEEEPCLSCRCGFSASTGWERRGATEQKGEDDK